MTTEFNRASVFRFYFNLVMVVVYAAVGFAIAFRILVPDLARTNRIVVVTTLLLYAAYRLFKTVKRSKSEPDNTSAE
ncbi:MAG: hypothetical protein RL021_2174 [Bacteroidota bacterium]|jgi:Ca2+/Na+ antiporter